MRKRVGGKKSKAKRRKKTTVRTKRVFVPVFAKKTKKRRVSAMKRISKRRKFGRKARRIGSFSSKAVHAGDFMKEAGFAIAGAVGGSIIANKLPITNTKVKAAVPIVAGIALSMVKSHAAKHIATGMVIAGGLSLLRQMLPGTIMLAGEEILGEEILGIEDQTMGEDEIEGYDDLDGEDEIEGYDDLDGEDEIEGFVSPAQM
jgi:hypothetical protein